LSTRPEDQDVSEIAPALSGIGHPSLLILEFVEGWCLAQPNFFLIFLPNFGSERGNALVGTNGKEKVIAAFHPSSSTPSLLGGCSD
jgi:hypothetical protein